MTNILGKDRRPRSMPSFFVLELGSLIGFSNGNLYGLCMNLVCVLVCGVSCGVVCGVWSVVPCGISSMDVLRYRS